jgi:nitroreductase
MSDLYMLGQEDKVRAKNRRSGFIVMPLNFLLTRRSVVAARLQDPGPDDAQLETILRAAIRVPDHKALTPWRFIVFKEQARADMGDHLAKIYRQNCQDEPRESQIDMERNRFLRAPVVVAVISTPFESEKVPEIEQLLSAGAACQNMLHAANALGFAGQWVTEWVAYDEKVHHLMGLDSSEKIVGFIYIGSASEAPKERPRIDPKEITSFWQDGSQGATSE